MFRNLSKNTRIMIIVGIVSVICIILGEVYFINSKFKYSAHLDETMVTVDGIDITLREYGYYVIQVEEFVQRQAVLYDPEDPVH